MIKAIDTRYKGYLFRSRLEARWAVFLDALGLRWEYEKEGYLLDNLGGYLPDFWLPVPRWDDVDGSGGSTWMMDVFHLDEKDQPVVDEGFWIEIKPEKPIKLEMEKAYALAEGTKSNVLFFYGEPCPDKCTVVPISWRGEYHSPIRVTRAVGSDGAFSALRMLFAWGTFATSQRQFFYVPDHCEARLSVLNDNGVQRVDRAFTAARSARFEHGQSGV